MKRYWVLALTSVFSITAVTVQADDNAGQLMGKRRPMPAEAAPDAGDKSAEIKDGQIAQAPLVLLAKLESSKTLMQTMSMPPIYNVQIDLADVEALRGAKPSAKTYRYSTRDLATIPPDGSRVIVLLRSEENQTFITGLVKADDPKVAAVKDILAMPIGWEKGQDGWVSPWAGLHDAQWPAGLVEKGAKACVRTGRPAALIPESVKFTVEQLPAEKVIKWKNDYGDGLFKITLKNEGQTDVTIPALLKNGDAILWEKSLVIFHGDQQLLPPDSAKIPATAKPVIIPAGQSVSGTFNTLTLDGIDWPRGGSRVYFAFALQDRVQSGFFYYFSDLHDALREKNRPGK